MRTHQQPWDGLHWRRRGLLAFVVATVGVTACSGGNNGRDCTSTSSCPSGFLCVAQQCVQICAADHECGADRYCVAGTCQAIECEVDADCQSPAVCERLEDAICVSGACRYEPATAQDLSCDDGNQCTNDDSCSAGRCVGVPRVCNEPPASSCTDNNRTYLTYDSTGNCDATSGACQYAPVPIACENCTANCLGQCGGITCPTQNGGCRIQGTCNPSTGSCDYTTA